LRSRLQVIEQELEQLRLTSTLATTPGGTSPLFDEFCKSGPESLGIIESFRGAVRFVDCDTVTVIYDINGEVVEQEYSKDQFRDNKIPLEGSLVQAYAFVRVLSKEEAEKRMIASSKQSETNANQRPSPQREEMTGPVET
jgi:hypothetical protein